MFSQPEQKGPSSFKWCHKIFINIQAPDDIVVGMHWGPFASENLFSYLLFEHERTHLWTTEEQGQRTCSGGVEQDAVVSELAEKTDGSLPDVGSHLDSIWL